MPREQDWQADGFYSLIGGMDSGNLPSFIQPTQAAFLLNATVRGGVASCRPGYIKHRLTFPQEGEETKFKTGRFQGAHDFKSKVAYGNTLIASIGGRIYRINVSSDFSAHYIGIPGDDNPAVLDHVWMEQAGGRWLVI